MNKIRNDIAKVIGALGIAAICSGCATSEQTAIPEKEQIEKRIRYEHLHAYDQTVGGKSPASYRPTDTYQQELRLPPPTPKQKHELKYTPSSD